MFIHKHPYPPFFPEHVEKLIVGTLPPPRFSIGNLKPDDVDFCYGSRDGLLWKVLDCIFKLNLLYENTDKAIQQRKQFLTDRNIGICDIVASCERAKIDASDLGIQNVQLRNIVDYLYQYPTIKTILFTGGNSKNGPEYFFRKHLKKHNLRLELVDAATPKIHQFQLNNSLIKTISLTAPSGSANRAIGSNLHYKLLKQENPNFSTFDFRVLQYQNFF